MKHLTLISVKAVFVKDELYQNNRDWYDLSVEYGPDL